MIGRALFVINVSSRQANLLVKCTMEIWLAESEGANRVATLHRAPSIARRNLAAWR